jgi:hypothetical protein
LFWDAIDFDGKFSFEEEGVGIQACCGKAWEVTIRWVEIVLGAHSAIEMARRLDERPNQLWDAFSRSPGVAHECMVSPSQDESQVF